MHPENMQLTVHLYVAHVWSTSVSCPAALRDIVTSAAVTYTQLKLLVFCSFWCCLAAILDTHLMHKVSYHDRAMWRN